VLIHDGDVTVASLVAFLESEGAAGLDHGRGRTLLDHLVETSRILCRWGQPTWLTHAALIHSVYGTEAYHPQLVSLSRRDEVAALAGIQAERLAYLFSVTPRRPLLAGTYLWARELASRSPDGDGDPPTRGELDALVLMHMANLAEQARAADGSPGRWLARTHSMAQLLLMEEASVAAPPLAVQLASFEEADEGHTRTAYLDGLAADEVGRGDALALAAALCPVVAEPCVWLAHASWCRGDGVAARCWAAQARRRLWALGTSWDKRLSFEEWLALIDALDGSADEHPLRGAAGISHPRALFEALVDDGGATRLRAADRGATRLRAADRAIVPPDPEAGRRRFQRYVERFPQEDARRPGLVYPDLPSRPWHDPSDFPLVAYLESHFDEIRAELLAATDSRFHPESERIGRTGDWDVAFLYERGRRHDEVCAACPVTTRGIETQPTIRTLAGLIYVSRMREHTHIDAHRGPTNLRVRCHLGIEVPEGDCAIRVADETRRWTEGRCLVFDDYFVHEAWNHTDEDRLVLIVDLWHPCLSDTEVMLLEGLHTYAYAHAERLGRYWSANARAARQAGGSDRPGRED
jgi:hypothetical protein